MIDQFAVGICKTAKGQGQSFLQVYGSSEFIISYSVRPSFDL